MGRGRTYRAFYPGFGPLCLQNIVAPALRLGTRCNRRFLCRDEAYPDWSSALFRCFAVAGLGDPIATTRDGTPCLRSRGTQSTWYIRNLSEAHDPTPPMFNLLFDHPDPIFTQADAAWIYLTGKESDLKNPLRLLSLPFQYFIGPGQPPFGRDGVSAAFLLLYAPVVCSAGIVMLSKKGGKCRKGLSICQLQSCISLSRGFTTRMEDMRFTGIQDSSHGSELLSPLFGCAQIAIGIPEWLRGSALPRLHSAVL